MSRRTPRGMHSEHVEGSTRRRMAVIIGLVPAGAILGFLGGLLIEIMVGLIAGAVFSADHPRRSRGVSLVRCPVLEH